MEKKTDLRVIRTKNLIRNTFLQLLEEKDFDEITVRDLTTRAEINRGTFYVHYKDKNELMWECQQEIMLGMSEIAKKNLQNITMDSEDNSGEKPQSPAVTIFEFLNENKVMMKALLGPKGDITFQTKLRDFLWKTLMDDTEHGVFNKENLLVPEEYIASYIAFAHIGVIQKWLEKGSKESPREMARILSTINLNGPFATIGIKPEHFPDYP